MVMTLECLNPSKYNWDTFRHGFDFKKKDGILIHVKLYQQRHSFSRSESENEMAEDREREVKMKKIPEKRESRW